MTIGASILRMADTVQTLASNLRALWSLRRESDLPTQEDVAKATGMNQTTFSRLLRAKHAPTLTQINRLAEVFKVEPWQLLAPTLGTNLFELTEDRQVVPVTAHADQALLRLKTAAPLDESANRGDGWSRKGNKETRSRRESGS